MNNTAFERPVHVLFGFGYPARIDSVVDAFALLNEWPRSMRTSDHDIALKACRAALDGEIDADLARATFVAFARRNHLLVGDTAGLMAAKSTGALAQARLA
ncbi:MAG: DUF982 domain-containing protein [Mesorhizobium sp.]|nr:DUF982 domain-containing protein [Mesorhizobium sp.]